MSRPRTYLAGLASPPYESSWSSTRYSVEVAAAFAHLSLPFNSEEQSDGHKDRREGCEAAVSEVQAVFFTAG